MTGWQSGQGDFFTWSQLRWAPASYDPEHLVKHCLFFLLSNKWYECDLLSIIRKKKSFFKTTSPNYPPTEAFLQFSPCLTDLLGTWMFLAQVLSMSFHAWFEFHPCHSSNLICLYILARWNTRWILLRGNMRIIEIQIPERVGRGHHGTAKEKKAYLKVMVIRTYHLPSVHDTTLKHEMRTDRTAR